VGDTSLDAVVVGNVGIDTSVYFHGGEMDFTMESHFTENLDCVGQAGGYGARGFAQLGKRTAFLGYVGDDFNGRFIRQELARDGIDTTALFIDPAGTSRSINFMYPDGRRRNFYDGKGHMALEPDPAVCRAVLTRARLAHFNIPHWARRLLPAAKELGITISCDLQDIVSPDDGYRREFIDYADILFFSAANHGDPTPIMRRFLEARPELIVLAGRGAQGCALGTRDGIRLVGPVTMESPVVDTNGAGDSLAVGFLAGYVLEGRPLEESLRRGQVAARHACTQKARSSSLITAELMERYLREQGS